MRIFLQCEFFGSQMKIQFREDVAATGEILACEREQANSRDSYLCCGCRRAKRSTTRNAQGFVPVGTSYILSAGPDPNR